MAKRIVVTSLFVVGLLFGLAAPRASAAEEVNACGCYKDTDGTCKCTSKKGKCACPGECEPVGCEAKRQKEADKEADAALKRIQAKQKKASSKSATAKKEKAKTADDSK